jgi:hypothetical protein
VEAENGINLLKWSEKFQSKQAHIARRFLATDARRNGRGFVGHQARRTGRRSGYGEMNNLFGLQNVRGRDTSAGSTNIERFRQLYEFDP